jgi:arsenate reductase
MNIQIFGTKKCSDTRKAERFFKERRISFHFRDLNEKGVSKGELENIKLTIPLEELIDKQGKQFQKRNLSYMVFDIEEELINDPLLFKTPLVRNGRLATAGYKPDVWKEWIKEIGDITG